MTWQDISTYAFPEDFSDIKPPILVKTTTDGICLVDSYVYDGEFSEKGNGCGCCATRVKPIAWMPCPA